MSNKQNSSGSKLIYICIGVIVLFIIGPAIIALLGALIFGGIIVGAIAFIVNGIGVALSAQDARNEEKKNP